MAMQICTNKKVDHITLLESRCYRFLWRVSEMTTLFDSVTPPLKDITQIIEKSL